MSILPLLMTYEDNILWTPNVNYHNVRPSDAIQMINCIGSDHVAINSAFAICPYEICSTKSLYPALQSLNHTGSKAIIKISKDYSSSPLKKVTVLQALHTMDKPEYPDPKKHEDDYDELISEFCFHLKDEKSIDTKSAKKFIHKYNLDIENDQLVNNEDFHHTYRNIFFCFQKMYKIRVGFVEGAHRAFCMFYVCFNIKFDETTYNSNINHTYDQQFLMKNSLIDDYAAVHCLTSKKEIYNWNTTTNILQEISELYHERRLLYIHKTLADVLTSCVNLYLQNDDDELLETLSNDFLQKTKEERQQDNCALRWFKYRYSWAEKLYTVDLSDTYL